VIKTVVNGEMNEYLREFDAGCCATDSTHHNKLKGRVMSGRGYTLPPGPSLLLCADGEGV
jgi:hypothetical protein